MVETSFNEDYFRAVLLCDTLDTDPFSVPSCMPLPQQGEANNNCGHTQRELCAIAHSAAWLPGFDAFFQ